MRLIKNGFIKKAIITTTILASALPMAAFGYMTESSEFIDDYNDIVYDDTAVEGDGLFYIPSVDVEVPVHLCYPYDSGYAQAVVDEQNSAALIYWNDSTPLIADHWNQGFINIKDCASDTKAFMKHSDGSIDVYYCNLVTTGYNTGDELYTSDWQPTSQMDSDLYCYTCNGNWQNIYIVFFKKFDVSNAMPLIKARQEVKTTSARIDEISGF